MSADRKKPAHHSLTFEGEVPVLDRTKACREFLRLQTDFIVRAHHAGASGIETTSALSAAVDIMLSHLFDYALRTWEAKRGKLPCPVSLITMGGYGRGELSPHSDIDIMFLFPSKSRASLIKPLQEHLTNEILYPLWDCNLKVGHSTRTVDEVFAEARVEIQSKTALLETRRIAGSKELYATFSSSYRTYYTEDNPAGYITARLEDQASRRQKFGNTVFLQEPDIKNGVGGLRDFQNAYWMAKVKLGIESLDSLVEQSFLHAPELRAFREAYDFLLRARAELHFGASRPTDLLDLEAQGRVAMGLGYTDRNFVRRVEQFMRDYYRAAQTIYRSSRLVENRLALTVDKGPTARVSFAEVIRSRRYERIKRLDGFVLRGKILSAMSDQVFREDPSRLVRVFRHAQRLDAELEFELQALISRESALIDDRVRASPDANTSFKAILDHGGEVHPALNLMHELGVLGKFVPEFDGLTCLVQHEYYHRYTADIHTLNTIRELDVILGGDDESTHKYRKVLRETDEPNLLYLILLLHDIGKAKGIKNHADSGVELAQPLLNRLGITGSKREIVTFIIRHHLIMARFWQKRDVDDPATASAFAEEVSEPDLLRYLYVHTFCDARGTASGLWNSYKDTLHSQLFRGTMECLVHGEQLAERHAARLKMIHGELIAEQLPDVREEEIAAHFNLLPDRYFLNTAQDEVVLHLRMVNQLLQTIAGTDSIGSLRPVIEWQDDLNRSLTVVHVVTWDRAGLFYKLAGAFAAAGLSVLTAKVISREDHIAIDTFYVTEPGSGVVQSEKAQKVFHTALENALMKGEDLLETIQSNSRSPFDSQYRRDNGRADLVRSKFPPQVDVYHELSTKRTIVEIQAPDQIGLLFKLARSISEHEFDITFARIGTERHVAIDTFYIVDVSNAAMSDVDRLRNLRAALLAIITPSPVPAKAAS